MSFDTFCLLFKLLLRFIPLTGEWNGGDKLASAGGCTSPGFHSTAGADFPPNRGHTIPAILLDECCFRRSSFEVITDEPIEQPM